MNRSSKIILSFLIIAVIIACVGLVFAAPKDSNEKKKGDSYADKVERRIDKLTMVIAQKEEENVNVEKAEGLMLKAIDLFKQKKFEESMDIMDEVERSLGLEPMREEKFRERGERPFQPEAGWGPPPPAKKLTDEEKAEFKTAIKKLIKEAQSLIEKGDYEAAFEPLTEAHQKLAQLTGKFMPMPTMPPMPMDGRGPGAPGGPWGDEFGGPRQGPGAPSPPPQGEERFQGPGQEPGMERGYGTGMRSRMPKFDPEKHFQKLREMGEEGYEKAIGLFEKSVEMLKKKEIKFKDEAIKKYEESKKLHEEGKLDDAFDLLRDAFVILRESMPRPENAPQMGPGEEKRGMGQGQRDKFDKGKGGRELSKEEREKIEASLNSLKEVAQKYVKKFGEDEFIKDKFTQFKTIERAVRRGEINVKDGLEKIKGIEKEIRKKLGEEKEAVKEKKEEK